jgi:hypothetical protein
MYIKLTNNIPEVYSIQHLHSDNPQVSFPKNVSDDLLAEYHVYPVRELTGPSHDPQTHYLKQSEPYQVDGSWQVHYTVEPLPVSQVVSSMRAKRDQLLAETDWIVAKSYEQQSLVPSAWVKYRQELRDITLQDNFPYEIVWPDKPTTQPGSNL